VTLEGDGNNKAWESAEVRKTFKLVCVYILFNLKLNIVYVKHKHSVWVGKESPQNNINQYQSEHGALVSTPRRKGEMLGARPNWSRLKEMGYKRLATTCAGN
jgi:hypothetical protein